MILLETQIQVLEGGDPDNVLPLFLVDWTEDDILGILNVP